MARIGETRTLTASSDGAVYVEFLICFMPVFVMFLGMVQFGFMFTARLVVEHAAYTAARSAIVTLDDDPMYYEKTPRNTVANEAVTAKSAKDRVQKYLTKLKKYGLEYTVPTVQWGEYLGLGGPRMQDIRDAAGFPLLAISPSFEQLVGDQTVYKAIGGSPGGRAMTGAFLYNAAAVAVTFPGTPGGQDFKSNFEKNDDITVRVTYLFHCAVPIVSRFMCDDAFKLREGISREEVQRLFDLIKSGAASPAEIAAAIEKIRQYRAQPGVSELDAARVPWLTYLTAFTGARYAILRAEASMPNQGAAYTYQVSDE